MLKNKFIGMSFSIIAILVQSCSLQIAPGEVGLPGQPTGANIDTLVAGAMTATLAAQTALANNLAATQTTMKTDTPVVTFTPSLTSTATFTLTPAVPMVSVSVTTNCRSGPTTAYDLLGILKVGETAQVVGRSVYTDSLIIKLPSNPGITCWLWVQNAKVVGDISKLPLIKTPPTPTTKISPTPKITPTPLASFNVVYVAIENCPGGLYALKFKVTNTGKLTWESNRVIAKDKVTTELKTVDRNIFPNWNVSGCAMMSSAENLEAGEVGYLSSSKFNANPAGHAFKVTIWVCSNDGMTGTCTDQELAFTP